MSTRPPTPNILAGILNPVDEELTVRQSLRWDYTQAGDAAEDIIRHTVQIKRSERLASQAVVDAGQHLQAVKDQLPHGDWEDWLQTEFNMSDQTARNMINVAKRFADKTQTVLLLQPSVLYMLAGDSVPEPAREAVIQAAQAGPVTKAAAANIIREHRPPPAQRTTYQQNTAAIGAKPKPGIVHVSIDDLAAAIRRWLDACPLTMLDSQTDKANQCRILAVSRRGQLWDDMLRSLPLPWRLEDVVQALMTAAQRIAVATPSAAERPASAPAPLRSTADPTTRSTDQPVSLRDGYDSDEWYTPAEYIERARKVLSDIDMDPASSDMAQDVVQANLYWTKAQDGLTKPWWGRIWLNPPYSDPAPWVSKLILSHDRRDILASIILVNNATETSWFQALLERFPCCVLSRRIAFWRQDHSNVGARQGQCIFYSGPNALGFYETFGPLGIIVKAYRGEIES